MNERATIASYRIVFELAKSVGLKFVGGGNSFDWFAVQMENSNLDVVRANLFFLDHSLKNAVKECLERNAEREAWELLCAV
jgi:hypothetical protein